MREMFDKGGLVATVWETCHHEPDVRPAKGKRARQESETHKDTPPRVFVSDLA